MKRREIQDVHTGQTRTRPVGLLSMMMLALVLAVSACGSSADGELSLSQSDNTSESSEADSTEQESTYPSSDDEVEDSSVADDASDPSGVATDADSGVDLGVFFDGALVGDATTEDCTLSGGAETSCYRFTVSGFPSSYDVGPFCPSTITDDADAGGIWFDGKGVYDLDGEFIANLADLYDDDNWQMYDDNGDVFVTETAEEFDDAARPDVDPELKNHCVEGRLEWLENSEPVTSEVVIPIVPVAAESAAISRGNQGVTLDGVTIAASAPVEAILGAYTIAAFDDCGAHFNPFEGYHMHGAVGCSEIDEVADGETPMFGYALDGFPIHSPYEQGTAPANLDECNGHSTEGIGYHYHANNAANNQVLECLVGQYIAGDERGGPRG